MQSVAYFIFLSAAYKIFSKVLLIFVEFISSVIILRMLKMVIIDEVTIEITQYINFGLRQINLNGGKISLKNIYICSIMIII